MMVGAFVCCNGVLDRRRSAHKLSPIIIHSQTSLVAEVGMSLNRSRE